MKKILQILSVCALVVATGCGIAQPRNMARSTITLGGQTITVSKAVTSAEQTRGLGGVRVLSADQGMLFLFPDMRQRSFWMKDMLIPIDIIWLKDDRIVGIEKNAAALPSGTSDKDLPLYTSPEPINYVLEVQAGFSDLYKLSAGDRVIYH